MVTCRYRRAERILPTIIGRILKFSEEKKVEKRRAQGTKFSGTKHRQKKKKCNGQKRNGP